MIEKNWKELTQSHSDIWASMGEEDKIPERAKLLAPYRVDQALMGCYKKSGRNFFALLAFFP